MTPQAFVVMSDVVKTSLWFDLWLSISDVGLAALQ